MKKLLVLLSALILVLPLAGCNREPEDTGPISIDGKTPDADNPGDNKEAGGADLATPQ